MSIVLDVQGFKIEDNKFIVKELAAYDGDRIIHYVFKPPFPFRSLPSSLRRQAVWLMNNHHCIHWKAGFTPLYQCAEIIRTLCKKVNSIYVKGEEKANFIRKYSTVPVIEIPEESNNIIQMETSCFFHQKSPCVCALSNVLYLYNQIFK